MAPDEGALSAASRRMDAFAAITQAVSRSLDLQVVLDEAIDLLPRLMQMEITEIQLLEEPSGDLVLVSERGMSDGFRHAIARVSPGHGMAWVALRRSDAMVVQIEDYPDLPLRPAIVSEGIVSIVFIPLRSPSQALGIMVLASRTPRRVSPEDLSFYTTLGRQIGLAVQNALHHKALFREREELARVNRHLIGRELKMAELKRENTQLRARVGLPPRPEKM